MAYNKNGYNQRAKAIQEITNQYYEPENQAKCYRQVWRKYIYPQFGVGYVSFLRYLKVKFNNNNG